MFKNIRAAKRYIYLETYIFDNDNIGKKFKRMLLRKVQERVDIKIMVDGMGSKANKKFFLDIIENGGDVRIFKEFEWSFRLVKKNTSRDHRKLLVIDDEVSYIGSSNITSNSLTWREANLKINGDMAVLFKRAFLENFNLFDKHFFISKKYIAPLKRNGLEIIRDIPSLKFRCTRKQQIAMIRKAQNEIIIEVPYFLPYFRLRKELKDARVRGVKVIIIVPKYSDIRIIDLLREKYLGKLHESGINIMLFTPEVLHSKLMVVDEKQFMLGSSNMDNRSYSLQFEINLYGSNYYIIKMLMSHFRQTLAECEPFDYKAWKRRTIVQKIVEKLLSIFRYSF
ncbi:MAG: phosphatidylserine/phosphatidylglycerophosphate/cardiolipin synthase family protein [Patescibacteria group bacterium]|nr:phosphatidylserine/phosphatidylglycerophosphate/cardiolipin synthase family protein [Patescibacteria group bacterium]